MSYTAVPTVSTGDIWTATNHNVYIRENFAAGIPDIVTTKGDLFIGAGANSGEIIAIGANNTALRSNSTGVGWTSLGSFINTRITLLSAEVAYKEIASGNIDAVTTFGVPAGTTLMFGWCYYNNAASSAYLRIAPSYDTAESVMICHGVGSTIIASNAGIIPLDSTGGFYYEVTDSSDYSAIGIWGYV